MQQIEGTAYKHDAAPVAFPFAASENQFILPDYLAQFPAPQRASTDNSKRAILACTP
jgi:hypothetical protein